MTRFLLALTLAVSVLAAALAAHGRGPTVAQASTLAVSGAAPSHQFRGLLKPSREVQLTAPLDGLLKEVLVKEGTRVEKDDALALMDDGLAKVMVESARLEAASNAEIRHADLEVTEAQLLVDLAKRTLEQNAASEWEYRKAVLVRDQAKAASDKARDTQILAQSRLKLEEEKLSRYTLRAPFAGRVIRIPVEPGASLTQRDPIMQVCALDTLEAGIYVSVDLMEEMRASVGRDFALLIDKPRPARLSGKLKTVDPVVETASQTFRCVFTVANPGELIPAGIAVTIELPQQ